VGYLCETGDFIRRDIEGKLPKEGSLAVIKDIGAYGYSMASNYNSIPRPPEVLVREDGTIKLIRKNESIGDSLHGVIF
ncbi:MAG: diaminopimelate decarboxylase, partial [Thermotogaceae bacterium]|nr:diaminopimelate decarboxylase [Thermotogaceae bacterium]